MKAAYFDCFSGASGDMILGALIDAGVDPEDLVRALSGIDLAGYEVKTRSVTKNGLGATHVRVAVAPERDGSARHLSDIVALFSTSRLPDRVRDRCIRIFTRLAEAEARVHRISPEAVHFHEVGAVDAIVDVAGAVIGLDLLEIDRIECSPIHVGCGTVSCDHGLLPVPAPATLELVKTVPVYSTGVAGELLTPTGAAILTTLCGRFGPLSPLTPTAVGYGAGTRDLPIPNLLRLTVGTPVPSSDGWVADSVAVVETAVDDMNPQIFDHVSSRLFGMGVLDVRLTPVQMKKNRPGVLVTVLCAPEMISGVARCLVRETTTLGVRWRVENRLTAERRMETVHTAYGAIPVKKAVVNGATVNVQPEYEALKKIALETGVPLKTLWLEALTAASRIG